MRKFPTRESCGKNRLHVTKICFGQLSTALEAAMARQSNPILEWREQYARRRLKVDFEPLAGAIFHASVKPILPELRIVRAALSPGFLFRDDDLIRDGDDSIGFVVAQSGQLTLGIWDARFGLPLATRRRC